MTERKYNYDDKCEELADHFLARGPHDTLSNCRELAQAIQDAIEAWFAAAQAKVRCTP